MSVATATVGQLVTTVERILATGRIRHDDAVELATRLWSMIHGVVLLEIAGAVEQDGRALTRILGPMTVDVFVGMGDERERAEGSMRRAAAAIASRG
jgi:hypothetical protein